jgi:Secretion system C-terminal sorting domain
MKQMLLLSYFTLMLRLAVAQITITASTFPSAGDTLRYASELTPGPSVSAIITPPGGSQAWDLSSLMPGLLRDENVYQPASQGKNASRFPGAELVVIGPAGETYYNRTTTQFENMGFVGQDPAGFGINVVTRFGPALVERKAPLRFFDVLQGSSNLTLPFSVKELPDVIKNNIPGLVDSVRVRISIQRLSIVDAWGTLRIPGGQFPVLRERRTEYTTNGLDVKAPIVGWIPLPTSGTGIPGLGDFLGTDTTVTYRYYNDKIKEEIAIVTLNNQQSAVRSVRYKDIKVTTSVDDVFGAPNNPAIHAYPNPAIESVRFDCMNLPASDYTLKIFNIVGRIVWKETHPMSGNKSIRVELDHFKKGTYLYSLEDGKGHIVGTKRLVVIKP